MVVLLTNSTKIWKRKEVTREENEDEDKRPKKTNRERGAELFKTWCARSVKFLHHALFFLFSMFCVWLRIGYSCFRWVQGIPPVIYPTAWILFCGGGMKERLWGGKEKFVFGSVLLWGWIVDILIRFGLCWDSFGSSVDAQCYKGF
jgi:hypothetical protein